MDTEDGLQLMLEVAVSDDAAEDWLFDLTYALIHELRQDADLESAVLLERRFRRGLVPRKQPWLGRFPFSVARLR